MAVFEIGGGSYVMSVCRIVLYCFWFECVLLGQGEPNTHSQLSGDSMIEAYLGEHASRIHDTYLEGIESREDWAQRKEDYKGELLYMLGLDPLPERTPLKATQTGVLKGDGYVVEMIHYQSSPGLYVTGNLYRPANVRPWEKLPTILYVCGHAMRGRDGNKTAYQSNGIWFARHGYVCLIIDTVQRGELAGVHHGTYSHNRWWWHSRGYTSAGVECWNGIRGIDYLTTRSDVDPERIGVTGISGGGAVSFWVAAADERVKVAVPISGMADLPSYVSDHVIDEHCDCMFLHNTFEWPWGRIAFMVAPRPLLFVNSDQDPIFPMDANERVINRLERVYSLFGAGDQVDSVVSIGGHAYRKDVRKAAFRFMNTHLKDDATPVNDSEVDIVTGKRGEEIHPIPPERLRVFPEDSDLPKDASNASIDRHFVPVVDLAGPLPGRYDSWKASLIEQLRRVTFRSFPSRIPAAIPKGSESNGSQWFETEAGIDVRLRKAQSSETIKRILLIVNAADGDEGLDSFANETDVVYFLEPRGTGSMAWTIRNPPNYVARSHALLGRTVDDGRVWDIAAAGRFLAEKYKGKIPLYIVGKGAGAVLGAYSMLLEPGIRGAIFDEPILSHMDDSCPALLNVLRVCDVPDILGALAPRDMTLSGLSSDAGVEIGVIYNAAGASGRLKIEGLIE